MQIVTPLLLVALGASLSAECNTPPAPVPAPVVDAAPPAPSPTPTVPPPMPTVDGAVTDTAITVYNELWKAGCLQADPVTGVAWVQQALSDSRAPTWLGCLAQGGTVKGCAVPCGDAGASKR